MCDTWERLHARPYFAAAAGKSPLDPVWRTAAQAESGVDQGTEVAAGFWDIAAFYDSVDHEALRGAARRLGFDKVALELGAGLLHR